MNTIKPPFALTCAGLSILVGCGQAPHPTASDAATSPTASMDTATMDADTERAPQCEEPDTGLPSDVFCAGLYVGRSAKRVRSEVLPYKPGVTLWSDGADKQRYLYLPPGATIDTSNMDAWRFPVGTRAFKEFRFHGALVETRVLWKRDEKNWEAGTYVWSEDQTTATLNTSRQPLILDFGYEIPTAKDCGKCHHGGADKLLGVEAVALALPNAEGLTLSALAAGSMLSDPPQQTTVELPNDPSGLAGTALGYLHANCGMPCHSSRGLGHETELLMRLRADEFWVNGRTQTPQASATQSYRVTVKQPAVTGAVTSAFPDTLRIAPGDHARSLVWLLSHRRGDYQMPPLVSHQIDEVGTQQLADWIDSLSL